MWPALPTALTFCQLCLVKSKTGRDHLVEQSGVLSLREGPWKFIEPGEGPPDLEDTNTETGQSPTPQLYSLSQDLGETNNLSVSQAQRFRRMQKRLQDPPATLMKPKKKLALRI